MRKLILSIMVTMDGFAAGPNGELDWIFAADDELDDHMTAMLEGIDAMIFGRVAYQALADYWPSAGTAAGSPRSEIEQARLMNSLPKFVVSRTVADLPWAPATRIGDDLAAEMTSLKQQQGKDIALFAGPATASAVMALGLIDEYRFIVHPVLLGEGQPLFRSPLARRNLLFVESRTFEKSGVVMLRYHR